MPDHREVERTYAPSPDQSIPDLTVLPGVAEVGEAVSIELSATYFDTADLALLRAGVSLRRRTGGSDEGWHLKIPAGDGRDEIQLPLSRAKNMPPAQLRTAVIGWTRGEALESVALIETRRSTRPIHDAAGAVLAELADDRVTGTPAGPPGAQVPVEWREWELELVAAGPELLEAADGVLASAGVEPKKVQRKIAVVLADRYPAGRRLPKVGRGRPSSRALHRRLTDEVAELLLSDSIIRRGGPDGGHRARVACRRLRGALATYRPILDRVVTDQIRDELKWVAHTLGDARDVEVVHERLRELMDVEPRRLVAGPVRRRLGRSYGEWERSAAGHVNDTLRSDRYLRLLATLDRLVADPPWTALAEKPAGEVLPPLVLRDWKQLRQRVRRLEEIDDDEDHDAALHDVRKAAKRLRYAAETLVPVWGKDAERLAKAAQRITGILGERHDTTVSRRDLVRMAAEATAAGESSFTYGRLHASETVRAAELNDEFFRAWDRLAHKKLRSWL